MHIGVCKIKLRIPEGSSLKDKRRVLKSITSRIGNKVNVSVDETDDNDLWQLATLGISCVSNDKLHVNEVLSRVVSFVNDNGFAVEMLDYEIEIITVF